MEEEVTSTLALVSGQDRLKQQRRKSSNKKNGTFPKVEIISRSRWKIKVKRRNRNSQSSRDNTSPEPFGK